LGPAQFGAVRETAVDSWLWLFLRSHADGQITAAQHVDATANVYQLLLKATRLRRRGCKKT
jgi:hypothetical protein